MNATECAPDARPVLSETAPAKINLALHVTGRRGDGYHLLETIAAFTALGDRLTVTEAGRDEFRVFGPHAAQLTGDGGNLVTRARDLLRGMAGEATCPPVAIALEKELPVASGLGGGSSDAAAALKALRRHWRLDIGEEELARAALTLGADLPMCLAAQPLVARGVGESISPLPRFPEFHLVLANPGTALETPRVFAALERCDNPGLPALPERMDHGALLSWLAGTGNDLEEAAIAIAPEIGESLAELDRASAVLARMSGSGATCFGIFEDETTARRAAKEVAARRPGWFVKATKTGAAP